MPQIKGIKGALTSSPKLDKPGILITSVVKLQRFPLGSVRRAPTVGPIFPTSPTQRERVAWLRSSGRSVGRIHQNSQVNPKLMIRNLRTLSLDSAKQRGFSSA